MDMHEIIQAVTFAAQKNRAQAKMADIGGYHSKQAELLEKAAEILRGQPDTSGNPKRNRPKPDNRNRIRTQLQGGNMNFRDYSAEELRSVSRRAGIASGKKRREKRAAIERQKIADAARQELIHEQVLALRQEARQLLKKKLAMDAAASRTEGR